jgi:CO/xanthine dehydrogenase Mo-binding subunit
MISAMLGLPASKLKVVPIEIGGGFGGKIAIHGEAVAVRLAQKCRRPVKLVFSREEVLQGGSGPRRRGTVRDRGWRRARTDG